MCEIAIFRPIKGRKKGPPCRPVSRTDLAIHRCARTCPAQRRKPSRFRPPTLTRRSPRWHSLGQRTKLPQTTTTTLGTPCLPRLYSGSGEAPGGDSGAAWGAQHVGRSIGESTWEGVPGLNSPIGRPILARKKGAPRRPNPQPKPSIHRRIRVVPGCARSSGASRADSDHHPSRAGHQDGIRLVKGPNSLKLLLLLWAPLVYLGSTPARGTIWELLGAPRVLVTV